MMLRGDRVIKALNEDLTHEAESECVILFRNTHTLRLGYVSDGDGDKIMVYRNRAAAVRDIPNIPVLQAFPFQIVTLDELPPRTAISSAKRGE